MHKSLESIANYTYSLVKIKSDEYFFFNVLVGKSFNIFISAIFITLLISRAHFFKLFGIVLLVVILVWNLLLSYSFNYLFKNYNFKFKDLIKRILNSKTRSSAKMTYYYFISGKRKGVKNSLANVYYNSTITHSIDKTVTPLDYYSIIQFLLLEFDTFDKKDKMTNYVLENEPSAIISYTSWLPVNIIKTAARC